MNIDEGKKAIEELKAQGNSEEEIAGSFYLLFRDGKINVEELEGLVNLLGFQLTEEFKSLDPEAQKTQGYEEINEEEEQEETPNQDEKETDEPQKDGDYEEKKAMGLFDKKDAPKEEESDEEKEAMRILNI